MRGQSSRRADSPLPSLGLFVLLIATVLSASRVGASPASALPSARACARAGGAAQHHPLHR